MEKWFRDTGRPALADALSEVCDRLEQDFTARKGCQKILRDLADRTDSVIRIGVQREAQEKTNTETEHERLRIRAANVDRLEQQIQTLKNELAQLRNSTQIPLDTSRPSVSPRKSQHPPQMHSRAPLTPISANQNIGKPVRGGHSKLESLSHTELLDEYLILDEKHGKLRVQATESVKANERLQERLRQQKESLSRWKEHAVALQEQNEKQQAKITQLKAKGAMTASTPATNSSFTPDTGIIAAGAVVRDVHYLVDDVYRRTGSPGLRTNTTKNREQRASPLTSTEQPSHSLAGEPDGVPLQVADELPLPPMPTVRKSDQEVPIKAEPSSDTPVVVSERSVRKRGREDDQVVDTPLATKVKIEDSSDPVATDEQHQFVPHSSIDFDDRALLNPTPRRNRAPRPDTRLRDDPSANPFTSPNSRQRGEIDHTPGPSPSRGRRVPGRAPTNECGQEKSHAYPAVAVASVRSAAIHPDNISSGRLSHATGLDYDTANRKSRSRCQAPHGLGQRIASLAEDGALETDLDPVTRPQHKNSLLDTLLHTATPEKSAIDAPSRLGRGSRQLSPSDDLVPRRRLDFRKTGRKQTVGPARPPEDRPGKYTAKQTLGLDSPNSKALNNSGRPSKRGEGMVPLRERPQSELRPEDFKVNPRYNDGLDYAYTEVVRNKDDRACLSGCVQEACCGAWWRAEALRERVNTSRSAFQANLEAHLGDDAWRLSTMSSEEKETMWIRARMQELANTYGKHNRHRFPRKSTPPGFFNPDFPSTQELLAGKEEGARVEREQVAERWREARKPNQTGLWLFRDE